MDQEDNGDSGTPPVGPMHPQFPPTMGREQVTIVICHCHKKLMSEKSYFPEGDRLLKCLKECSAAREDNNFESELELKIINHQF